jgi:acetyl esterase/lipase
LPPPFYGSLRGLLPLLIQAGTRELLFDGISAFVEKAQREGIRVHFEVAEGMFHCWQVFAGEFPEGEEALKQIGDFTTDA